MKRGEITTVDKLIPGDRFYKKTDRKKIAFEFIGPESYGKYKVCNSAFILPNLNPPLNKTIVFNGTTEIVFLRNINQ